MRLVVVRIAWLAVVCASAVGLGCHQPVIDRPIDLGPLQGVRSDRVLEIRGSLKHDPSGSTVPSYDTSLIETGIHDGIEAIANHVLPNAVVERPDRPHQPTSAAVDGYLYVHADISSRDYGMGNVARGQTRMTLLDAQRRQVWQRSVPTEAVAEDSWWGLWTGEEARIFTKRFAVNGMKDLLPLLLDEGLAKLPTGPPGTTVVTRPPPEPTEPAIGPVAQRWAVVVGVSKYQAEEGIEALRFADRDAKAFRDFLVSPAGGRFPPEQVRLLTNEQATTRAIRTALFDFLKAAIREDLVIVYFSGHGAVDPDRPQNLYLLTYDTDPAAIAGTAFPMRDVRTALMTTVEAQRVVVLADACHSGGVAQTIGAKGVGLGQLNEAVARYWSQLSQTGPGRVIFTSSRDDEISQESPRWGGGHGVFTWALLEGLRGKADADADGLVTLGEAIRYTDEHVRRQTRSAQHPTVAGEQYDPKLPMGLPKP